MTHINDGFGSAPEGRDRKSIDNDWLQLLFPESIPLASPNAIWIAGGPLGGSRLATRKELVMLVDAAQRHPDRYVRLLQAYGIGHDPKASVIDFGGLPIPLGLDSPNLLFFGRSGSGKTQKGTLPVGLDCIRLGHSIVYVNIKGPRQTEILRRFARAFGREDEVIVLSPAKPDRSVGCTLVEGCEDITRAKELASSMGPPPRSGDRDWDRDQAKEWLQHSIHAVCKDNLPSARNLLEIRKVVLSGDYLGFAAKHPDHPVLKGFAEYDRSGNLNAGTVRQAITELTDLIDHSSVFLSRDEFRFSGFSKKGGIVIIEIDQSDIRTLRPIVTMLLSQLVGSFQRVACASSTGGLPHKTVVIVDELIASGKIPGLVECLHTCREQNFSFVAGVQSISQIAGIYGEDSVAVLDGFQSQIALADGLDPNTARYFSERSGIGTIALPSVVDSTDEDSSVSSRNWQMMARPALLPSDIQFPNRHPIFGLPATVLLGDGKTPMFQAYLTPAHQDGSVARLMEEALDRDFLPIHRKAQKHGSRPIIASSGAQGVVLVLTKIATNKQEVSRMIVRLAGITMNKARQMCDSLPARLGVCSNRTNAIEAIELLRRSGAVVEIAK
jgi:hypothetical protein